MNFKPFTVFAILVLVGIAHSCKKNNDDAEQPQIKQYKPAKTIEEGKAKSVSITHLDYSGVSGGPVIVALADESGNLKVIHYGGKPGYQRYSSISGGQAKQTKITNLVGINVIVVGVLDQNSNVKLISFKIENGVLVRKADSAPITEAKDFSISNLGKNGVALAIRKKNDDMALLLYSISSNGDFEFRDFEQTGFVSGLDVTAAANIVTGVIDSDNNLKLISYDYDGIVNGEVTSGSTLKRCDNPVTRGYTSSVNLAHIGDDNDPDFIVATVKDAAGELSLLLFDMNGCNLNFVAKNDLGGDIKKLASCDKSYGDAGSIFEVAVLDKDSNLKFLVYSTNSNKIERVGSGITGKYSEIAISSNWVTAGVNANGNLSIVWWGI